MTASVWTDTPKNRYAAARGRSALPATDRPDASALRRRAGLLLAGVFLAVNLATLAALAPAAIPAAGAALSLPDLSAPRD